MCQKRWRGLRDGGPPLGCKAWHEPSKTDPHEECGAPNIIITAAASSQHGDGSFRTLLFGRIFTTGLVLVGVHDGGRRCQSFPWAPSRHIMWRGPRSVSCAMQVAKLSWIPVTVRKGVRVGASARGKASTCCQGVKRQARERPGC